MSEGAAAGAPGAHQAAWAKAFIATLVHAGARRAVVSPGSRSTPLVLALLEQAAVDRVDVVDERVAGFVALGIARAEGKAPLLVCTSGSAVANWHPAVVEADVAGIPLLLLSADRPAELIGSGANQTIDQTRLFGSHVRASFDCGPGREGVASLRAASRIAMQAWQSAHWPRVGPVHCNLRFDKPLEPSSAAAARSGSERAAAVASEAARLRVPTEMIPTSAVAHLVERIRGAARPVFVGGPRPWALPALPAARAIAAHFPVIGDPGSWWQGAGGLEAGDLLLESQWLARHPPDLVVQVGPAPTSSAWEGQLERCGGELVVANGPAWADPASLAGEVWLADPGVLLRAAARRLGAPSPQPWLSRLREADRVAAEVRTNDLASGPHLSELEAVRLAADAVPRGGFLALGNSLAIRHAATGGIVARRTAISTQRGASGIDGLIAGAAGSVRARSGVGILVLGDLSALHDLGGLAAARHLVGAGRLVVVVLDNAGGRIFERLPVARTVADLRPWTTPDVCVDLVGVARGLEVPAIGVDTAVALRRALRSMIRGRKPVGLIRARLDPHDAGERSARLRQAVDAALAELG